MAKVYHILIIGFVCLLYMTGTSPVFAQSCDANCNSADECRDKISKCQEAWNQMEAAKKPHVESLRKMEADIAAFQQRITVIESDVAQKAAAISSGEQELTELLTLAGKRIREFYKRVSTTNPLVPFLSSTNAGSVMRMLAYQSAATNEDKKIIIQTALFVKELQDRKAILESQQQTLAGLKKETDKRAASVRKLVGEANAFQAQVSSFIASLTTQQQSFLAQKLAGLGLPTSLGAGPLFCTDDRNLDPGFSPAFAFYTFGIPHRVGMNQYGAYGRARDGQSVETILQAYFANVEFVSGKEGETVVVNGTNEFGQTFSNESMNIEEYLKHLYEMPSSWDGKALQAQAIAARSYALAEMAAKGYLKPSQSDQVIKRELNAQSWIDAVEATKGKIMAQSGSPIKAWYASTAGGYTYTSSDVWGGDRPWTKRTRDTNGDVGSFSDLLSRAYDRDSPCFYAAQGYRSQYGKSAWLKSEEVADIVNVILLARNDSSTREHLYQPDRSNPAGTDTWDPDRVRQELRSRSITPFSSITSVSISGVDWGVGRTTGITFSGDAGTVSFDGPEFKDFFNLRAPANIQIVGPLFNIERK